MMERIKSILKTEQVDFEDKGLAELIQKYFPDFRRILNELQRYSVGGKIDVGILSQIGELNVKELMKHMKDKDFSGVRKWVVKNLDNDLGKLYGQEDLTQTSDKVEYGETLKKFKQAITGKNGWEQEYLDKSKGIKTKINVQSADGSTGNTKTVMVYPLKFTSNANNDEDKQAEKELLKRQSELDDAARQNNILKPRHICRGFFIYLGL